jgi:putative phosphoribosyl transferase
MIFKNREEAAHLLARELTAFANSDAVVLALPRGGVPLGYIIAKDLNLPLDVILIKKIGYPRQPEYAVGAVSLNSLIINPHIDLPETYFQEQTLRIRQQLQERYKRYKKDSKPVAVKGKPVLLVDDGIATGYTILAAAQLLRQSDPARIILAVPVAAPRALDKIRPYVDAIIFLDAPEEFQAVGQCYEDFSEVSHEEVIRLLADPEVQEERAK